MWALQPYISSRVCSQDLSSIAAEAHSSIKDSTDPDTQISSILTVKTEMVTKIQNGASELRRCNSAGTWEDAHAGRNKKTRYTETGSFGKRLPEFGSDETLRLSGSARTGSCLPPVQTCIPRGIHSRKCILSAVTKHMFYMESCWAH